MLFSVCSVSTQRARGLWHVFLIASESARYEIPQNQGSYQNPPTSVHDVLPVFKPWRTAAALLYPSARKPPQTAQAVRHQSRGEAGQAPAQHNHPARRTLPRHKPLPRHPASTLPLQRSRCFCDALFSCRDRRKMWGLGFWKYASV